MSDREDVSEKVKYTAADLRDRLKEYHSSGEWVIQFEVANSTGMGVKRHADAVAMSIWPSRGYKIHGFEVKVSRSDWQREMREPQKADAVGQYCDAWFLVAPPDIVNEVEIPETWGWLIPSGKSLRIKKQPLVTKAKEVGRDFIAAMLRNNHAEDETRIKAGVQKARAEDHKRFEERLARELKNRTYEFERLKEQVAKFEADSGIKITNAWGGDRDIGKKLKMLEAIGNDQWNGLPHLITEMRRTLEAIETAHRDFCGTGQRGADK